MPDKPPAPLSWITYGFVGVICIIFGLGHGVNAFVQLVVQPEMALWFKVLVFLLMLAVPFGFIGSFIAPSKGKLIFLILTLVPAAILGAISSEINAPSGVAGIGIAIAFTWFGIYSLTHIPVSIRQRRIEKCRRRR